MAAAAAAAAETPTPLKHLEAVATWADFVRLDANVGTAAAIRGCYNWAFCFDEETGEGEVSCTLMTLEEIANSQFCIDNMPRLVEGVSAYDVETAVVCLCGVQSGEGFFASAAEIPTDELRGRVTRSSSGFVPDQPA